MLDVTVRFYITSGGIAAGLLLLWRIAYAVGRIRQAFEDHVQASDARFQQQQTDIRELRVAGRRNR
jgi:hypothetical protein